MSQKWHGGLAHGRNRPAQGSAKLGTWAGHNGQAAILAAAQQLQGWPTGMRHRARSNAACTNSAWRMAWPTVSEQWSTPEYVFTKRLTVVRCTRQA